MMQLLSAWKESILLFKPSNFKLFLLVTLKSFIDSGKVWFRYWWWLIGVVIAGPYFISSLLNYFFPISGQWMVAYDPVSFTGLGFSTSGVWQLLSPDDSFHVSPTHIRIGVKIGITCVLSLLYTSLYLCVRPSVAIKNCHYFVGYGKHFLYITVWFLLLDKAFIILDYINMVMPGHILSPETGVGILFLVIFSFISIFFLIFLLDSDTSFKSAVASIWCATKLVAYNFPFLLICLGIIILLHLFISMLFVGILAIGSFYTPALLLESQWIINSIEVFFMLLLACFFVNYYIKKIHDNYSLYFGSN